MILEMIRQANDIKKLNDEQLKLLADDREDQQDRRTSRIESGRRGAYDGSASDT